MVSDYSETSGHVCVAYCQICASYECKECFVYLQAVEGDEGEKHVLDVGQAFGKIKGTYRGELYNPAIFDLLRRNRSCL
jgi:hypothetical protein